MKIIHVNSEKDLNKFNKMIKKGKMLVVRRKLVRSLSTLKAYMVSNGKKLKRINV